MTATNGDNGAAPAARPALVLGGGGTWGVVQAAYVHAAREAGYRPSLVVGTSVGALNATWVALHPDDTEGMLQVWHGLEPIRVFDLHPMRMVRKLARRPMAICTNQIVPRLIADHADGATFEDCEIPLAVVATNLTRSTKQVFQSGPLAPAIMASTAIPGVYDPVEIDGELYVDGGLVASLDLATAVQMGATEILAIDLSPPPPTWRPRTVVGILRQSFGVIVHAHIDAMEACLAHQLPVRILRPDLSNHSPWRLDNTSQAIARNLALARAAVAEALDGHGRVASGELAAISA
jgi:NTE family protein